MAETADPVVIVSAVRSPLGRFMGELSPLPAHKLGSHVIAAALDRAKLAPEKVDEVFMGCVLPAGQGQAPARQAARAAGLPDATGATTVNKVCGSGMKASHVGARHHSRRFGRDRRLRRHGEHEQRAVSAGEGTRRLSRRP
ncbi:acetyl-CoA acetyltransferase [Bradyrhizobium sp. LB13.1]